MKYMGNFFSLPNEIFLLGLSPGELAVYCYLRRCENQKTHQCWPSYKTIGEAVGMCANTVSRHVKKLEERGLIAVEPTKVTTKAGVTRNGTLQFTLLPPQNVIARHYEEKLAELELTVERQRVQELLEQQTKNTPCSPAVRGCVPSFGAGQRPCPTGAFRADLARFRARLGARGRGGTKSRINAGVVRAASAGHNCPQCGQLRGFWVYQKWGQKQAAGITFVVTIPELLLP